MDGVSFISVCSLQVLRSSQAVYRTASTTFYCYWGHARIEERRRLGIDSVCYDAAADAQTVQLGRAAGWISSHSSSSWSSSSSLELFSSGLFSCSSALAAASSQTEWAYDLDRMVCKPRSTTWA